MNFRAISVLLCLSLIPLGSGFIGSDEFVDLTDYPNYCVAYSVEDYCNQEGFESLLAEIRGGNFSDYLIHNLAVPDEAIYDGPIEVSSIEIISSVGDPSIISARYVISNPTESVINVSINFLGVVNETIYLDGVEQKEDLLVAEFQANEAKELVLEYAEAEWGEIFAYNANLYLNYMPFLKPVREGSFSFLLPEEANIDFCMPGFYTTGSLGRLQVIWEREDFIPWTNPFNDLLCTWNYDGGVVIIDDEVSSNGDSTWLIILTILIAAGITIFYLQKRGILNIYHRD